MFKLCPTLLPKFKGFCSSPSVIMLFVYMKCRFSLSYRELEEMMMIRGAMVDHSTLQRWVKRFVSLIDSRVRARKKPVNGSWRMDETYLLEGDLKEAGLLLQNALTTMEQVQHPDAYRVLETLADLESKKAAEPKHIMRWATPLF